MLAGLRSESELARLDNTLSLRAHDILHTVLNPESLVRLTRHGLNGFLPDAFGLTLKVGAAPSLLALANCFVLTERGGVDPRQSGQALLWTPGRGHEAFASLDHLRETLSQRLKHPDQRQYLLENLPASQCVPHQPYEPGPLQRIDENLLHNRLRSYADTVHDGIAHRLGMGLSAGALQGSLNDILRHAPPTNLTRAMALAQSIIHRQALPAWLGMAAPDEQLLHAQLLEQQRLSAVGGQDYLHGIVPLREHVNHTLTALLNARFPEQENNPDHVLIPTRLGLEGTAQTLTDFAMGHLPNLTADHIRPRSRSAAPLPTGLDGHAVMQLVQQLGLKSFYQKWLDTHLDTQAVERRQRCTLFCRQLPWQVLRHAHEEHLEERLSDAAWGFVRQIFDMPDAVARDAINGVTALIRPLELIATAGAAVVRATGLYLIGPRPGEPGPQVLYTPYRARRVLQEYTDEADLLRELNSPGELQDWIALNLDAAHQATYRNLWREALHGSVPDIRLGSHPIAGSALLRLFDDNTMLLKRMFENQFEPLGRRQWEAVVRLLEKGAPGAVSFMAGKLEIPNVLWRSYSLFKDAAEHLQQRRWNEGLRAFIRGVAQMAALRKEADYFLPDTDAAPAPTTISDWLKAPPPTAAHWGDIALTAPLRTRLQRFETHSVALNTLTKSLSTHVYTDNSTRQAYVPVAGKVYPVKRGGTRWCIHDGEQQGPCVQHNAEGKWVLDLDRLDPRFGKTLSRYADRVNTRIAQRQTINIEAHGMREIAALSSWKARCINEALNVATYYAVTSKRNLVHYAGERDPASRLGRFFSELFGVHRVTPAQLIRIETSLDAVLNALVDPTLTRPDSMRFVTGTSRWSPEDTYAFTLPDDAEHKIYLVDRFFDPRMDIYQNRLTVPFDISAHARAATLIHELTHVTSQTEDIAYLDSMRPFHDLINTNVLGAAVLRTDLRVLRSTALSTLTPVDMLFKSWDAYAETWEDLGSHSLTRSARNTVLKLAGAKTLDEARHVFMSDEDKRIDIILANADSIAYLITQLGRELEAGA
ncbi:dermonecrotic toxin domain-containing protein [Pseudomonas sp. SDO5271_S396]